MERELDLRGLRCPIPYARAKALTGDLRAGDVLVVLVTDPEAPVDLAALAADEDLAIDIGPPDGDGGRRISLRR